MIRSASVLVSFRQALAGALGGLIAFLLLEPRERANELQFHALGQGEEIGAILVGVLLLGLALGGCVSALLTLADELSTGRPARIIRRTFQAGVVGGVIGLLAAIAGQIVFSIFIPMAMLGGMIFQVIGRTIGWTLLGVGIGLSAGLIVRSGRRVSQGALGGAIGGAIGGFAFDRLAQWAGGETGTLSRLVGFTVLGAMVGLATAIVQQLGRTAWVSFLTGSREGQQFVLYTDATTMGRDELAGIPLFGDPRVDRTQCVVTVQPMPSIREVGPVPLLRVNGVPVREAGLADGATLEIGKHRLRFHLRAGETVAAPGYGIPASTFAAPVTHPYSPASYPAPAYPSAAVPAFPSDYGGAVESRFRTLFEVEAPPDLRELWLRVFSGPDAPARRTLEGLGCTIGRELDNTLPLSDMKISRHHARIEPVENGWLLVDLQSRNGTRLNGLPVVRGGLAPGDVITVGDTEIAVERADGDATRLPV